MSAPMHTPGPWGIDGNLEVWIKAGHLHVATIPRAYDGDWSEANARLIAAAPELASQGEKALTAIDDLIFALTFERVDDKHRNTIEHCKEVAAGLRAAIAKAKGAAA